jgi:peptidoglycan/xylan/chitin deacetylase (PgdA/CDA1 family)
MPWIADVTGGLACAAAVTGGWAWTQWPTSQLLGPTLLHGPEARELALTFDDGPNDRFTQEILEKLAHAGVRATFFFIGNSVLPLPWLVRQVAEAGHVIGNHTMSHPNLAWLPTARIRTELQDCNMALEDILGAPVHYFRPPYGGRRPAVLHVAEELGLQTVLWNSMGYDWRPRRPVKEIMKAVERGIRRNRAAGHGSTVLLHDGAPEVVGVNRARTVAATASLLERGAAAQYRFVTVADWWPAKARVEGRA